ncbi:MAG: SPOR domain-containing protein [Methyloprofundus sp.]|nr:SPOR domain-containing protein [Methyloprofundus sp.]
MQDYKDRVTQAKPKRSKSTRKRRPSSARRKKSNKSVPVWRWGLVLVVIAAFVYFLYSLSATEEANTEGMTTKNLPPSKAEQITSPLKTQIKKSDPVKKSTKAVKKVAKPKATSNAPIYDFYTVLPDVEFVIPDHEVKTRKREERIGKVKKGVKYTVQAGAFRGFKDADSLKAKLLLMGFSPKIEKAQIGSAIWYRVKMGPYKKLASVDAIQARLKANKMDALVVEVKN